MQSTTTQSTTTQPTITINHLTFTLLGVEDLGYCREFSLQITQKDDLGELSYSYEYCDEDELSFKEVAELIAAY